jgi:hypothetical protein
MRVLSNKYECTAPKRSLFTHKQIVNETTMQSLMLVGLVNLKALASNCSRNEPSKAGLIRSNLVTYLRKHHAASATNPVSESRRLNKDASSARIEI